MAGVEQAVRLLNQLYGAAVLFARDSERPVSDRRGDYTIDLCMF